MEAATTGSLALARAYLQSSDAALRAEAAREGATDATRRGTEVEAQQRRQLALNVAEGAAQGARSVSQLREETSARVRAIAAINDNEMSVSQLQNALQDEAALRPLLQLQAVAEGEALTVLTDVITRYRKELQKAREVEAHLDALGAIAALRESAADRRALMAFQGDAAGRQIEAARIAAEREADHKNYGSEDRSRFVAARIEDAQLEIAQRRADQVRQIAEGQEDSLRLLRAELEMGGLSEQQRDRRLRLLGMELQLNRELGPAYAEQIRKILAGAEAEDRLRQSIEQVRDAQREIEQVGGSIIDEVFNPDNWDDWGETGMRIIRMLLQELLILAAVNPLKNALFGQSNPTLGSVFQALGMVGSAVAGGGAPSGWFGNFTASAMPPGPVGMASGSHYFGGGLTWIAENGPELVSLPRGAKITPAGETRRMLAANEGGVGTINLNFHNDFRGADPAAVARIEADQRRMEAELPARVVAAWEEARERNIIR
jgi:hypothetical protein